VKCSIHYSFLPQYRETNVSFTWKLEVQKYLKSLQTFFYAAITIINGNEHEIITRNVFLKIYIDAAAHNVSCLTNKPMNLLPLRFSTHVPYPFNNINLHTRILFHAFPLLMQLLCVCDEDADETNFFYWTLLEVFLFY
jgi:hypothetical protein